jgi:hypothetical protein
MPHALFQCCHHTHEVDQDSCRYTSIRFPQTLGTTWLQYSCVMRHFETCTKLTLHYNHRFGHFETEHAEGNLLLLRRHLENWSRGPAISMRSELLVVHEKCGQLCCVRVGWKIKFLLTFETPPFFCACPLLCTHLHLGLFNGLSLSLSLSLSLYIYLCVCVRVRAVNWSMNLRTSLHMHSRVCACILSV